MSQETSPASILRKKGVRPRKESGLFDFCSVVSDYFEGIPGSVWLRGSSR